MGGYQNGNDTTVPVRARDSSPAGTNRQTLPLPPHPHHRKPLRQPRAPRRRILLPPPHHPPRPSRSPFLAPDAAFDLPSFEDRPSIQFAISEIGRRIALNQLDSNRARLLLRCLRIASINLPKEPRTKVEPTAIVQVEEIQYDPDPRPPCTGRRRGPRKRKPRKLNRQLLRRTHTRSLPPCPVCNPTQQSEPEPEAESKDSEPAILPNLQAATEPAHTSYPKAHTRPHKRINLTADSRPPKAASPKPFYWRTTKDKPALHRTSAQRGTQPPHLDMIY